MDGSLLLLISAVVVTLGVSAFCSLMEAAVYAVPLAYVKHLAERGSKKGKILLEFKKDISKPIAAILILNTIANTGGASLAGWAGANIFSGWGLTLFSAAFVLSILYFSEIMPKVVGVVYSRQVAPLIAFPLAVIIKVLSPFIYLTQFVSRMLEQDEKATVSLHEILAMIKHSREEGVLDQFEGSVIVNVVGLDKLLVRDVLTPRVVVFRLPECMTMREAKEKIIDCEFTRIPLHPKENPDQLNSYVIQRDIYKELVKGNYDLTLKDISRPLMVTTELARVDKLLMEMFEKREHICTVIDEHGSLAGIITLEDIIEEIVGREIVDEYDSVEDLRAFAKVLRFLKAGKGKK
ncbi:MAG: HlyC/CorC family transporter [Candidatus Dadabacteria bacterium]|nr:MAG: HlyC/CorC family transporter [Candidatus Dadabacteria bacterium]